MNQRLGVFGGTFDPPHLGHLILASEALAALSLGKVLWVLTLVPPHKIDQTISGPSDRLAMLNLAIEDESGFELCMIDMDRPGPHYTLDTLKLLHGQYPGADLILLLGGDSLHDLPTWHQPAELVAICHEIGVMRRPGDAVDVSLLERKIPGLAAKVRFVDAPLLEIASHEIRRRTLVGLPFRYYLPSPVYEYISQHKLYQRV